MSFLILLSPSKTQELGPRHAVHTLPQFLDKAEILVKQLQRFSAKELAKVMQMSDKLGEINAQRYASFSFPPQNEKSHQALLAFRGDVFAEIEADTYAEKDWDFAQDHLRILSGLYGLLRPLDLIQPYRLEMGGKFKPAACQSLYHYWKEAVSTAITEMMGKMNDAMIINLASQEYVKVLDRKKIHAQIIDVSFKQEKNGRLRTVAIHAKKARGALANFIIQNRIQRLEKLSAFSYNGYLYSTSLSSADNLTYVQK